MSSVSRSVKNVFRNKARTLVVILIIGLSIGVFLSMTIVNANIEDDTTSLSEEIDTTITITPAGSNLFTSSDTMNDTVIADVESVDNIGSVQVLVSVSEMPDSSTTTSMGGRVRPNFYYGIDPSQIIWMLTPAGATSIGSDSITEGEMLTSEHVGEPVALIGTTYSDTNGVNVGNHIYLNDTLVEVIGEYSVGNRMTDSAVITSYDILQDAYNISGVNMLFVTADDIGSMETVEQDLKTTLGDDYDIVPLADMNTADIQESLDSIAANSELGSMVSLITAAAVMIFVMILVTRERTREIGVLKAIGFKNSKIMAQFFTESMTLATLGFIVGVALTLVAGPSIANMFLGTATTSETTGVSMGGHPGGTTNILTTLDFTLSPELLIFTLVLALVLGMIGSLYPIIMAIKLKPAEALRYDE